MVRRFWVIIALTAILLTTVILEQLYTDNAVQTLINQSYQLQGAIEQQDIDDSKKMARNIEEFWDEHEILVCMFVDYRDVEQIGRQIELVNAHLNNEDFELAMVECNLLLHITKTFQNSVNVDWQNII